mmetsp:Transcript_2831/g.7720  ORF Transcript_2831/g.7720 Transcript_2831/m.7720 type:complete len:232 (+) Transcript_2831:488-1183(+)
MLSSTEVPESSTQQTPSSLAPPFKMPETAPKPARWWLRPARARVVCQRASSCSSSLRSAADTRTAPNIHKSCRQCRSDTSPDTRPPLTASSTPSPLRARSGFQLSARESRAGRLLDSHNRRGGSPPQNPRPESPNVPPPPLPLTVHSGSDSRRPWRRNIAPVAALAESGAVGLLPNPVLVQELPSAEYSGVDRWEKRVGSAVGEQSARPPGSDLRRRKRSSQRAAASSMKA